MTNINKIKLAITSAMKMYVHILCVCVCCRAHRVRCEHVQSLADASRSMALVRAHTIWRGRAIAEN